MPLMQLSELQLDALSEIGNIGAGNAATALATMIDGSVKLAVPATRIVPIDELVLVTSAELEEVVVSVYVGFEGQARGCLLLLFDNDQALSLLDLLGLAGAGDVAELAELEKSAISETGNIIASGYLRALGSFTHLQLLPQPPGVAVGMSGAVLDTVAAYLGQFADTGLVIQVNLHSDEAALGLELFMIPDPDGLAAIIAALGLTDDKHPCTDHAGA
jgi:chemotaxis protein CheC